MSDVKILIVEDEAVIAKDLESRLTTLGYSPAGIVRSAGKAIDAVRARKVELVLMNIRLRGRMKGITAAERIQREHHVPVIFLGGASDEDALKRVRRSGTYGFLIKPLDNNRDLRNAIELALTKHAMEVKLHESEDFFRVLFDESPIAIVLTDLVTGAIAYANHIFLSLLGRSEKDILGRTAVDLGLLHDPRDQKRLTAILRTKGFVDDLEVKSNAPQGGIGVNLISMRVINLHGKPHGLISVQDITERKRMDDELRHSQRRYQELVENARDAIFSLSPEGSFTSMNKAFENITGWTNRECIGKPYTDLLHPDDIPKALERLAKLMKGKLSEALELRIRKKSGGYITGEILGSLQIVDKKVEGILCVGRDISERKHIEEELKRSIEEKTHIQRFLLALSEASQNVLQIRTPDGVFQTIGNEMAKLGYKSAILTLTEDRTHLRVSNLNFQPSLIRTAEKLTGFQAKGYRIPLRPDGLYQRLIASGEAELVEPDQGSVREALPAKMRALAGRLGNMMRITRAISVPLKVNGEVHSLMVVMGDKFTDLDVPAVRAFAGQAEIALQNALLYQASQQEIIERRRVEETLSQSENRYRTTIDALSDSVHVVDPDLRFILVNESFKAWNARLGLRADAIGRDLFDVFHFLPAKVRTEYRRVFRSGKALDTEETFRIGDDEIVTETRKIPILEKGKIIRVVTIIRDVTQRKQAEVALLKSEEKFSKAFRTSPIPMAITRLKDRRGIEVNESFERVTGFRRSEVIGRTGLDLDIWVNPKEYDFVFETLTKKGRIQDHEYRFRIRDGTEKIFRYSAVTIELEGEACKLASVVDLTDIKKAEGAIRESEKKYKALIETTDTGYVILDSQGKVLDANREYVRLSGHNKLEDILGRKVEEWTAETDRARNAETVKKCLKQGFVRNLVVDYADQRGKTIPIEINATVIQTGPQIQIMSLCRDISERKLAEEALLESESKFRLLFETSRDFLYRTAMDGKIIDVNAAANELSGYSLDELKKMNMLDLYADPSERDDLVKKISEKGFVENFEIKGRKKDGTIIDTLVTSILIKDKDSRPVGFQGSIKDITERKRAETALRESERKARAIFDLSFEFIGLLTPEGALLEANRTALEFAGVSLADVKGKTFWETPWWSHSTEMKDLIRTSVKSAAEGNLVRSEAIHRAKDGTLHTIDFTLKPIKDEDGKVVFLIPEGRDITERKRSEEALQLQNRLQELLMNMSSTYINQPLETIESAIRVSLGELAEFVGADRSYIFDYDFDRQVGSNTHEWCAEGVEPTIDQLQDVPMEAVPELVEKHRRGESFSVPDVCSMPPGAVRDIVEQGSVKSFLTVPMMSSGECFGFVGFDWVKQHHAYSNIEQRLLTVFANMLVNIRRRKSAEEAIQESEKRFRALIENSTDMVQVFDPAGVTTYVSPSMQRITGYTPKELIGRSVFELIHPEDLARIKEAWQASSQVSGPIPRVIEARVRHADGTWHNHEAIGTNLLAEPSVRGFVMNSRDITERKQTEQELKDSEERTRLLANATFEGIGISDQGKVVEVNDQLARMLGYSRNELMGMPVTEIVAPESREFVTASIRSGSEQPYEHLALRKDGSVFPVEVQARTIPFKGHPARVSAIRDISDQKKAREIMENSQRALRLASVGTLAAGISHEINQPLTALKVKVDGMLFWGEEDAESLTKNLVPNLEYISAKAEKIDEIIRHMRSLIQREKVPPRSVDLNEAVHRALTAIGQQLASHNIFLELRLGRRQPRVLANETSLEQVVINLVTNAMRALDTVDLDCKRIRIATRSTASSGILAVSDNGPGIPEQNLNRIFEPLFTTERSVTSMGLGLSIVQFFVQEYKGAIRVRNRTSGGAAFLVVYPSSAKPSPEVS